MALLDKTTLQKSAGLLNATAPEDHFLAYITEGERDMLVRAGGKETSTVSGINAYPPSGVYQGGEGYVSSSSGAPPGEHGGSGPTHQEQKSYSQPTQDRIQRIGSGIEPGYRPEDAQPYGLSKEEAYRQGKITKDQYESQDVAIDRSIQESPSWFDGIKNYIESGGMIGMAINLTGEVLSKLGEYSSELQKKAMTMSLNSRVKSKMKDLDLNNPNSMNNPEIVDLHKDLAGIKDGTFTQNDFTKKYGSGDLSTEGGGDREIMNVATPYASYAVANQEPIESQAAKWYANLGGSSGGFNLTTAYADAKSKVAQTLGSPSAVGQLAVNQSPFYNWLKENSLNKGIL